MKRTNSADKTKINVTVPYRQASRCEACPLFKTQGHEDYVPYELVGSAKPEIAVIGEAPGNDEVKEGRPFIGRSGQLLRSALEKAGIREYAIVNSVSCRPRRVKEDGSITFREPTFEELSACSPNAFAFIKKLGVKKVILAGKSAIRSLILAYPDRFKGVNPANLAITNFIKTYPRIEIDGVSYYPVFHPSYILRNPAKLTEYVSSIRRVNEKDTFDFGKIRTSLIYRDGMVSWLREKREDPDWASIALDYETNTAQSVAHRKLVGIGFSNGKESVYIEARRYSDGKLAPLDLDEEEAQALLDFLRSRERVIVYNTSFESNVTYQLTGEWLDFDDAYTLAKIGQIKDKYRGQGLKYVASAVLGVEVWSGDVADYVREIKSLLKTIEKNDFVKRNIRKIAEEGFSGLLYPLKDGFVILDEAKSYRTDKNVPKSKVRELDKIYEFFDHMRKTFGDLKTLLEVLDYVEYGQQSGLDGQYLDWYSIPTKVLAEYNYKDTAYTYHVFQRLYEDYGTWYPYYIKQEWLSSHMEGYMIAWDNERARELAIRYAKEAIDHIEQVFSLPKFIKSLETQHRESVKVAVLEKQTTSFPKLTPLDKKTRDKLRKLTAKELLSKKDEIISNLNYIKKADPQTELVISSVFASLDKALDEYIGNIVKELKASPSRARKALDEGNVEEALKIVKEVFNPDSSHETTRSIFINAFLEDELIIAALLDYVNQMFFRGLPHFTPENLSDFEAWSEEIKKKGGDKARILAGYKKHIEKITLGMNDDFFKAWFRVFNTYYGVDVDDPNTWTLKNENLTQSWKLLYHVRVFKKILKAINGYILAGIKGALGAEVDDPTKPVLAYGPYDGRGTAFIPSTFHANTAETKRWQSPIHTIPRGSDIRLIYVPRDPAWLSVHFDYSQMEVRVLAGLAKDPTLLKAYEEGVDVHRLTASRIFKKKPEEVSKEERSFAKQATFSVLYGKGVESFARDFLAGDVEQAKAIIEGFFAAYPEVSKWVERMHKEADKTGKVKTLFGDPIDVSREKDGWDRRAQNYPIQSSASSLAALSGWELYQKARKLGMRAIVIGFTHDAFDFEVDARDLPAFVQLARKIATKFPRTYGIPAEIDLEIGPNMGQMFEFSRAEDGYHVSGPESGFEDLIERLEKRWDLEYEVVKTFEEKREMKELFVTKTAYSVSIGETIPMVEARVVLKALKKPGE